MSKATGTNPCQVLSLRVDKNLVKHLRRLSHKLSLQRDEEVTLSDMLRDALLKCYPMDD